MKGRKILTWPEYPKWKADDNKGHKREVLFGSKCEESHRIVMRIPTGCKWSGLGKLKCTAWAMFTRWLATVKNFTSWFELRILAFITWHWVICFCGFALPLNYKSPCIYSPLFYHCLAQCLEHGLYSMIACGNWKEMACAQIGTQLIEIVGSLGPPQSKFKPLRFAEHSGLLGKFQIIGFSTTKKPFPIARKQYLASC